MNTSTLSSDERKIYGTNLINELSIKAVQKVLPQLKDYLNKKVFTVAGDKTKAFQIELLNVPFVAESGQSYRTYLKLERSNLVLFNDVTIKDKEFERGGGYSVTYYKKEIDLGYIENGILTELLDYDLICLREGLNLKYNFAEKR